MSIHKPDYAVRNYEVSMKVVCITKIYVNAIDEDRAINKAFEQAEYEIPHKIVDMDIEDIIEKEV